MFKSLRLYLELPKNVYFLFLIQCVNRLGDFVAPFLTLLLTVKLHVDSSLIGWVLAVNALLMLLGNLAGGYIADRYGRRLCFLFGQTVAGLLILSCTVTQSPQLWIGAIIAASFFTSAVRPALGGVLGDSLQQGNKQIGLSLMHIGINLGVAIGPILAGLLFAHHLSLFFLIDAVTSFIAVLVFFFCIPESFHRTNPSGESTPQASAQGLSHLYKPLVAFLFAYICLGFVYVQYKFSLPLQMTEVFSNGGVGHYAFLLTVNALTVLILSVPITAATHKQSPLTNLMIAALCYAVGFGGFALTSHYVAYVLLTIIWSMGEVLVSNNVNAYLFALSPQSHMARIQSIANLCSTASAFLGTSLMGLFVQRFGVPQVWLPCAAAMIIPICIYILLIRQRGASGETIRPLH